MIYVYDGTFEGFLSAVFDAFSMKITPVNIVSSTSEFQLRLDVECYHVATSAEKADRVGAGMEKHGFFGQVATAFLSWMPNREMVIYQYIVLGFKIKEDIFAKLHDDVVRKVNDMSSQTYGEKQKWKGFLRFSIMENNVHFAEMSPKNNVLSLIMPHFCRRFRTMPFVIHDITYKQVGIFDTKEWHVLPFDGISVPRFHSDEEKYREAWKKFYDTTAVEGRLNLERRNKVIPKRYQKHMTELQVWKSAADYDIMLLEGLPNDRTTT